MAEGTLAHGRTDQIDAVRVVVQGYFESLYHSDTAKAEAAFHKDAAIVGYLDGKFAWMTMPIFLDFLRKTPAPAQHGEAYDMEIVSIQVTDVTAVVVTRDLYLGRIFTDTLSLLRQPDGAWLIINKLFRH
ncbi:nuclear transport factor 2 family protein [Zavarzinia sp. CC-PAN008]|uniref:nuclear transport factor 2 family protein n=1 Tax=Zavarzinia sp. CC-PAN008 TaxID=3243332 RepID=UPI003F742915